MAHLACVLGPAQMDLAEEAVQEAMLRALQVWPHQGVPENAAAWLFRVAHNAAIDAIRQRQILGDKTEAIIRELTRSAVFAAGDPDLEEQLHDDELRMIFMCCHPGIGRDASELGRRVEASACFRAALECGCSEPERRFLRGKLAVCEG